MQLINLNLLSNKISAYNSCNKEWKDEAEDRINEMCKGIPHGSGIDGYCDIDLTASTDKRIVFKFEFHHMDENGFYCGWTQHKAIITPTFGGFNIRITGKNYRDIKDYLHSLWSYCFFV